MEEEGGQLVKSRNPYMRRGKEVLEEASPALGFPSTSTHHSGTTALPIHQHPSFRHHCTQSLLRVGTPAFSSCLVSPGEGPCETASL